MFPSIKTRVHTESLSQNRKRIFSSIFVKSRVRQSSIKACIPYIDELKYSSNRCSPKIANHKNKKVSKSITETNQTVQYKKQPSRYLTKQTQRQQINSSTIPLSFLKKRHSFQPQKKPNKISLLIQQFEKINQKSQKCKSPTSQNPKSKKFNQCILEYQNLPKSKLFWSEQKVTPFIETICKINPFAKKLKSIVLLCLLKIGHIKTFQQNQVIHSSDDPNLKMIGIILWGEVLIKNVNNKMKIYLFSGDSMNQELLFQKDGVNSQIFQHKGQIMKAKTSTSILYFIKRDYHLVYQQLVKAGQKSSILLAQNMMKWSYAKKKNTRNHFLRI